MKTTVFIAFFLLTILGKIEARQINDTQSPIQGGFTHMGAVFHVKMGEHYLFSIFDNEHDIKVYSFSDMKLIFRVKAKWMQDRIDWLPPPQWHQIKNIIPLPGKYIIESYKKCLIFDSYGSKLTIAFY